MVTYRLLKPVRWGRKLIRIRASASAPAALGLSCPYYPGRRRSIATAVAPHTTIDKTCAWDRHCYPLVSVIGQLVCFTRSVHSIHSAQDNYGPASEHRLTDRLFPN